MTSPTHNIRCGVWVPAFAGTTSSVLFRYSPISGSTALLGVCLSVI